MTPDQHTVLILEDEFLIGADIQEMVRSMGCRALLLTTLTGAMELIEDGLVTFAILNHLISNQSTAPVAEALRRRNIPFVLCSGSEREYLEAVFGSAPIIAKPYEATSFADTIRRAMPS